MTAQCKLAIQQGQPLSTTPPGMLLLTLATAASDDFAPVPLLALLKHPLVTGGMERLDWLDGARRLDRALRGPRPGKGLHLGEDMSLNYILSARRS